MAVPSVLEKIIAHKYQEVAAQKALVAEAQLIAQIEAVDDAPRGFMAMLQSCQARDGVAVIAEVKKASPSAGVIREDFHPVEIAKSYAANGAACLSILTDKSFFQGDDSFLHAVRQAVNLPLLRKDFIVDSYQIIQSRALGADCVLLIAAVLDDAQLLAFTRLAHDLGMDVLLEVHNAQEFERALRLPISAIGVNNRNLHDFSVSLETTLSLQKNLPEGWFLISESGIQSHEDILRLQAAGVTVFLIGGTLMAADNPGAALNNLILGSE